MHSLAHYLTVFALFVLCAKFSEDRDTDFVQISTKLKKLRFGGSEVGHRTKPRRSRTVTSEVGSWIESKGHTLSQNNKIKVRPWTELRGSRTITRNNRSEVGPWPEPRGLHTITRNK